MNLKMILSQIGLLPEAEVTKYINGIIYAVRRPMLLEAAKDEPNITLIRTLKTLEETAKDNAFAAHKIHTLESTAMFVFEAQDKDANERNEDKKAREELKRAEARKVVMRNCSKPGALKPKSKAELDKMIELELQRADDRLIENFNRASEAIELIESVNDNDVTSDDSYDEAEVPEWVTEGIIAKVVDVATQAYADGQRRLSRARFDFQKIGPQATVEGALQLLDKFGVKQEEVDTMLEKARTATEELFKRLEAEDAPKPTTIDNPPVDNSPSAKKANHRRVVKAQKGITSADMAAAGGVKGG